jgi:hypothetical protein
MSRKKKRMNPSVELMKQQLDQDRLKWVHRYVAGLQFLHVVTFSLLHGIGLPRFSLSVYNNFAINISSNELSFEWLPSQEFQFDVHCIVMPIVYTSAILLYHIFHQHEKAEFLAEPELMLVIALVHVHVAMFVGITDFTTLIFLFFFSFHPSLELKNTRFNSSLVWSWIMVYYFRSVHELSYMPGFIGAMVFVSHFLENLLHCVERITKDVTHQQYFTIAILFVYTTYVTWMTYGGADSLHKP